jgi:hypothetical protein
MESVSGPLLDSTGTHTFAADKALYCKQQSDDVSLVTQDCVACLIPTVELDLRTEISTTAQVQGTEPLDAFQNSQFRPISVGATITNVVYPDDESTVTFSYNHEAFSCSFHDFKETTRPTLDQQP